MKTTRKQILDRNPVLRFLKPVIQFFLRNSGILIGLAALVLVLWIATSTFMNAKNLLTVLRQICQNALLAFGMTCVLIVGGIDLTVG